MSRALSEKSSELDLTPTSYAVLSLLALRPWTTYELAKQVQRSLHWFWPRAERKLYDEPKQLSARGLASASTVMTGKRAGTVYEITAAGRRALKEWLATTDVAPPAVEMEAMLHVFFAEHGTREQLVALLTRVGADAQVALTGLHDASVDGAAGTDAFPERRALNAVSLELIVRLHETIRDWSAWATAEVNDWPAAPPTAGPPERGTELFSAINDRTGADR
jgi:PadR family transcriptional regulator, regulatory protein AphA